MPCLHSNMGQSWRRVTDHLLGPFSVSFTGQLRPDPPILNLKQAQKLMYHFTQWCFCSLHTTVSLILSSALGSLVGPSRQKNWDLNSPALPWTYCKHVFTWGHVAGEQREEGSGEDSFHVFGTTAPMVREGLPSFRVLGAQPPSVHCQCATEGFPGAVSGEKMQ